MTRSEERSKCIPHLAAIYDFERKKAGQRRVALHYGDVAQGVQIPAWGGQPSLDDWDIARQQNKIQLKNISDLGASQKMNIR
jgi:hypothetical protein